MKKIPEFRLSVSNFKSETINQDFFQKGIFILYFYPKDMTPGCTLESQNFRDKKKDFEDLGVKIFGISKDEIKKHDQFCEKEKLNFPLISDPDLVLIKALDLWKQKSFMGKIYMGVDRSTFVIRDGEIIKEWNGVKVKQHIEAVYGFLENLEK